MRKADQMMNTDYSILPLHCCQGWDFSINSCVGGQSCRKSTSQFNLSGMDRYWLYRIYRSRCSTAAGSSCRKSYGYCQYGTVSLLWKSRLYHRWKHLYWRWYDKTNDLSWWLWLEIWRMIIFLCSRNIFLHLKIMHNIQSNDNTQKKGRSNHV